MLKPARADQPAALFQFSDGQMELYWDEHKEHPDAHHYVNMPDVFCLEQEEQPLPFTPVPKEGEEAEDDEEAEEGSVDVIMEAAEPADE